MSCTIGAPEVLKGMAGKRPELYQRMLEEIAEYAAFADQAGYAGFGHPEHHLQIEGFEVANEPRLWRLGQHTKRLRIITCGFVSTTLVNPHPHSVYLNYGRGVASDMRGREIGIAPRPLQHPHPPLYGGFTNSTRTAKWRATKVSQLCSAATTISARASGKLIAKNGRATDTASFPARKLPGEAS